MLTFFLFFYLLSLHNFYSLLLKHLCIPYDRLITFIPSGPFFLFIFFFPSRSGDGGCPGIDALFAQLVCPFAVDFLHTRFAALAYFILFSRCRFSFLSFFLFFFFFFWGGGLSLCGFVYGTLFSKQAVI